MPPLPYATESLPGVGGRLRVEPEDFVVEELPAFEPTGEGEHLYLWLEKHDVSHDDLVQHLADRLGVSRHQIGTAGIKDRRAVTRQHVSVPAAALPRLGDAESNGIRILSAKPHRHKLRSGQLRGNRFWILLRDVPPGRLASAEAIRQSLERLGIPNYFGPQRFGREGDTLRMGLRLLAGECRAEDLPRRRSKFLLRLALSAAQSELFNQVLAARLDEGLGRRVLEGDVMQVAASGGPFVVQDVAREQPRFDARETVIAGPIFGPKMRQAAGVVRLREEEVLARSGIQPEDFERFRRLTRGTRRPYWVYPQELQLASEADGLRLAFSLPSGSYATVLLREFMKSD